MRQVLRTIVRYQTQREASSRDPWAGLAVTLFNVLTDKADLRAWSTLPSTQQLAVLTLPAGEHTIQLRQGNFSRDLSVYLNANTLTFIFLTRKGNAVYLDSREFSVPSRPTS
ncbi:MAG: hypothetical protein LR015_11240 [Verrucomicrobia bacterium]|nr:hypothetical protein [Verrucomicrobiota bacterium]